MAIAPGSAAAEGKPTRVLTRDAMAQLVTQLGADKHAERQAAATAIEDGLRGVLSADFRGGIAWERPW